MIRFCALKSGPASKVQDQENHLVFDNSIWEQGKRYFDQHGTIKSVLVTDTQGRPVCLAWQDEMANQELRMLDELVHTEAALPFEAYYPQYDGVISANQKHSRRTGRSVLGVLRHCGRGRDGLFSSAGDIRGGDLGT